MPLRLDGAAADFEARFQAYLDTGRDDEDRVDASVAEIIARVAAEGDAALLDYTKRFDRLELLASGLRVTAEEISAAVEACPFDLIAAIDFAATRIEDFHRRQLPEGYSYEDGVGNRLGLRWTAVGGAGLYVPGGLAAYPSSVLMNACGTPASIKPVEYLDDRTAMTVGSLKEPIELVPSLRQGGLHVITNLCRNTRRKPCPS